MILSGILIIIFGLFIFAETKYKIIGLIIMSIGLNFFADYYKYQNIKESNQMTNWKHVLPLKVYEDVKTKYGVPHFRINKENGLVIWNKSEKQQIYDEIILRDEEINNSDNGIQQLCLYLNVKLYIPPKMLCKVFELSHRLSYNKGKLMLQVHTNSVDHANKLVLKVMQMIHKNKIKNIDKQIQINKKLFKFELEAHRYI